MRKNKAKYCPKCGSKSLYLENDEGIISEHCFLCGYEVLSQEMQPIIEMEKLAELVEQTVN
ncbi:MAG TPA: hypothetical protein DCR59_04790 [Dehalococcoidia bacterium]|jgi:ribosomal protein L37AE/L43A|nr:hypothetical protein [Dehalococcoidia bacterium]